ncbi:hypothetical protein B0T25DRAFT_554006 [Lasiosphaeria hispida]|uniref:Uncharacterized protein n=1 Tax=Lasiosphaeria hispida TaxID=260671 RepID=A0AAJ0HDA4_9PEZI|nr:hypothetical protein B0T25DRAFT_554006 [Lasiosphaeria hispida]
MKRNHGGLIWNAFMVDQVNIFFMVSWDTAQMTIGEVEVFCEVMALVLRKLVKQDNWDREVADLFLS